MRMPPVFNFMKADQEFPERASTSREIVTEFIWLLVGSHRMGWGLAVELAPRTVLGRRFLFQDLSARSSRRPGSCPLVSASLRFTSMASRSPKPPSASEVDDGDVLIIVPGDTIIHY